MKKTLWIVVLPMLVLVFGSGFLLGRSNILSANYSESYLSGRPENIDMGLFWQAWNMLSEKYPFEQPTTEEKIFGAISGLTAAYGDPYTTFFNPEEAQSFDEDISGVFGGVGMELGIKDRALTVIAPLPGTPADRAGIIAGDVVVSINGEKAYDMTIDEAIKNIRGEVGTEVTLGVYTKGADAERTIVLVRENINIQTLETKQQDGVFIISLYTFTENSPELFKEALGKFKASGSKKLVIDLRDNPGGYLTAAIDIASWFVPQGKVIVREDQGETADEIVYRSKGYDIGVAGAKVVVLVNKGSASASEIVAGAMKEHNVATIVGQETFGKGSVQELIPLSQKTSLKVTVARWLTPEGLSLSEESLHPDIAVELTPDDIKAGRDPQLDKAIESLK